MVKISKVFNQGHHASSIDHKRSKAVRYIHGNRAVKITMENGQVIFASMDEPREFIELIQELHG